MSVTPAGRSVQLPKGVFSISIDLELLWGVWDTVDTSMVRACTLHERPAIEGILNLLERYEVPATWAFVGRLLDESRGFDGLRGSRENWFAPDAVELILKGAVEHEIATHTYGHVYYHESGREAVLEDLSRAKEVHEKHGLPFKSLVFPRNQVGHLDVLCEVGIETFRSVDAGLLERCSRYAPRLRPAVNLLDKALPTRPPIVSPVVHENGLTELPSSMLLIGRNGMRRVASASALRNKLRLGTEGASERRGLFHLWFHPSNFYFHAETQLELLESVLSCATRLRSLGRLDILPMADVGDLARATAVRAGAA